eukprot:16430884-Heterocapsa_arctica.AAC.1
MGEICALSSGMYEYTNGAWLRAKELSEFELSAVETALARAANCFAYLMKKKVARVWSDVFAALSEAEWAEMGHPVDPHVFNAPKSWAAHAGACLPNLAA